MIKFDWAKHRGLVLEVFVVSNLAFLAVDIWIAHSVNAFARWEEWIPFGFSLVAPPLLVPAILARRSGRFDETGRILGIIIGLISVLVGLAGVLYHLQSQFFEDFTIKSLVYTAPFAAPLAYAGLGFLLVMNRMISSKTVEWGKWVVFFAMGGFFGNFVLTLCDHAQNGFFMSSEWIPVVSSAIAVGFLCVPLVRHVSPLFLKICFWVIGLQVIVGLVGFGFHLRVNLLGVSSEFMDNFIYGAPIFAPLLFPNLSLLAGIGIWDLKSKLSTWA